MKLLPIAVLLVSACMASVPARAGGRGDGLLPGTLLNALARRGVPHDEGAVYRAAAAAMLETVDPRSVLFSTNAPPAFLATNGVACTALWTNSIGFIRFSGLYTNTASAVTGTVAEWSAAGLDGLILDVRGASGHATRAIAEVGGLCVTAGTHLVSVSAYGDAGQGGAIPVRARGGVDPGVPIVLLADRGTGGAAEAFVAGVCQHAGVLLIGSRTAGDGHLRNVVHLGAAYRAYLAIAEFVAPAGRPALGAGVPPDIVVTTDDSQRAPVNMLSDSDVVRVFESTASTASLLDGVKADAALLRAVDVLLGLRAIRAATVTGNGPVESKLTTPADADSPTAGDDATSDDGLVPADK